MGCGVIEEVEGVISDVTPSFIKDVVEDLVDKFEVIYHENIRLLEQAMALIGIKDEEIVIVESQHIQLFQDVKPRSIVMEALLIEISRDIEFIETYIWKVGHIKAQKKKFYEACLNSNYLPTASLKTLLNEEAVKSAIDSIYNINSTILYAVSEIPNNIALTTSYLLKNYEYNPDDNTILYDGETLVIYPYSDDEDFSIGANSILCRFSNHVFETLTQRTTEYHFWTGNDEDGWFHNWYTTTEEISNLHGVVSSETSDTSQSSDSSGHDSYSTVISESSSTHIETRNTEAVITVNKLTSPSISIEYTYEGITKPRWYVYAHNEPNATLALLKGQGTIKMLPFLPVRTNYIDSTDTHLDDVFNVIGTSTEALQSMYNDNENSNLDTLQDAIAGFLVPFDSTNETLRKLVFKIVQYIFNNFPSHQDTNFSYKVVKEPFHQVIVWDSQTSGTGGDDYVLSKNGLNLTVSGEGVSYTLNNVVALNSIKYNGKVYLDKDTLENGTIYFAIPFNLIEEFTIKEFQYIIQSCMTLSVYSVDVQNLAWYQTSRFGLLVELVAITITIVSLGSASSVSALMISLSKMVVSKTLLNYIITHTDNEFVIGVATVAYVAYTTDSSIVDTSLKVVETINYVKGMELSKKQQELLSEIEAFNKAYEERMEDMQEKNDVLNTGYSFENAVKEIETLSNSFEYESYDEYKKDFEVN